VADGTHCHWTSYVYLYVHRTSSSAAAVSVRSEDRICCSVVSLSLRLKRESEHTRIQFTCRPFLCAEHYNNAVVPATHSYEFISRRLWDTTFCIPKTKANWFVFFFQPVCHSSKRRPTRPASGLSAMDADPYYYDDDEDDEPSAVQQMNEMLAQMRALRASLVTETNSVDERNRAAEHEHARLQSSLLSSVTSLMGQVASGESDASAQALHDAWSTGPARGEAAARAQAASALSSAPSVSAAGGAASSGGSRGSASRLEACAVESEAQEQLWSHKAASVAPSAHEAPTAASDRGGTAGKQRRSASSCQDGVVTGAVSSISALARRSLLPPDESRSSTARGGRGVASGSSVRGRAPTR